MVYIASPETQAAVQARLTEENLRFETRRRANLSAPTESLPLGHNLYFHIANYVNTLGLTEGSSELKTELTGLFSNCDWGNYSVLRDHIRSKFITFSQREVISQITAFLSERNISLDELVAQIRNRVIGVEPLLRKVELEEETEQ